MDVGQYVNFANGTQNSCYSKSYKDSDKAYGESGTGKTFYMYIGALRWRMEFQTSYNLFGTSTYAVKSQKWDGAAWVDTSEEKTVKNNTQVFTDDGSSCHVWRIRYRSTGGNWNEWIYGRQYIYGYAHGSEATYDGSIKGKHICLASGTLKFGPSWKNKDYVPTNSAIYDLYDTKTNRGGLILASTAENKIVAEEF